MSDLDVGIPDLEQFTEIGSGGFASVYAAWDAGFRRWVAVKILHNLDDDGRRRFDRERGLMGQFDDHPNIVTPYGFGYTTNRSPYLVMEYLRGGSLEDLIEKRGPLPVDQAIGFVAPIAGALERAHDAGVLHRDVKPANILLSADGLPKLTDFGIATLREVTSTQIAYSLAHSPPETFATGRDERDERSDLYSLASTLFNLVTGRTPFQVANVDSQLAHMQRIATFPVPKTGLGNLALDEFLAWALAKAPTERPQTAAQFRNSLAKIARPAQLSPASPPTGALGITSPADVSAPPFHTPPSHGPADGKLSTDDDSAIVSSRATPARNERDAMPMGRKAPILIALAAVALVAVLGAVALRLTAFGSDDDNDGETAAESTTEQSTTTPENGETSTVGPTTTIDPSEPIVYTGHTGSVLAVAQLLDGRIVSGGSDNTAQVWDSADPASPPVLFEGHARSVNDIIVVPDGRIATASDDTTVQIWNVEQSGVGDVRVLEHFGPVGVIEQLADGRIAAASGEGRIELWPIDGAEDGRTSYDGHGRARVVSIVQLADGHIASTSQGGTVLVWGPDTLATEFTPKPAGPDAGWGPLVELADGRIVIASFTIDILKSPAGLAEGEESGWLGSYSGHSGLFVTSAIQLTDGRIATASDDNTVHIWDPDDPDTTLAIYTGHTDTVNALVELTDGRIASASSDGTVHIWDPASLEG